MWHNIEGIECRYISPEVAVKTLPQFIGKRINVLIQTFPRDMSVISCRQGLRVMIGIFIGIHVQIRIHT